MLDVSLSTWEETTVITLGGRLDATGAVLLKKRLEETPGRGADVILDLTRIEFISSAGIGVLTLLLKESAARNGRIVLSGLKPAVRAILEITGMMGFFEVVDSQEDAKLRLRNRNRLARSRRRIPIDGVEYDTTTDASADCRLQLWTAESSRQGTVPLFRATLQEMHLAFGLGGLGSDAADASSALGEFVATGNFVAVVPAGSEGLADCLIPQEQATTEVFVSRALGLSGQPRIRARMGSGTPVELRKLMADAFVLADGACAAPPDILGLLVQAGRAVISGGFYADGPAVLADQMCDKESEAPSALILAVIARNRPAEPEDDNHREFWSRLEAAAESSQPGFWFHAHGVQLSRPVTVAEGVSIEEQLNGIARSGVPDGLLHLKLDTRLEDADVRIFVPSGIELGALRRIKVECQGEGEWREEWDTVTRRIYSDSARVVLKPLTGGFTSRTYRVESYDREGRKQLPTVLKIGSVDVTEREVQAYRTCVEKFILNNSTTIMGTERCGGWAGLRYNFLGITGPDSRITWLENIYKTRPAAEFLALLDRIMTDIFKPWYGQPRWEVICPYKDHDPRVLFDSLLDDAQAELGISPDAELLPCPPLGIDLPNPFHFLKHGYAKRRDSEFRWYTGINHGDLNLKNILLDERENVYIIDFSESRPRNIVSDFTRLEPIVKLELTRLEGPDDFREMLRFEQGLASATRLDEPPPWCYAGSDPMVEKAYQTICRLRRYADQVTLFETNLIPYLVAVLEWTLPVVSYRQFPAERKRMAAYSAALITRQIMELEKL